MFDMIDFIFQDISGYETSANISQKIVQKPDRHLTLAFNHAGF